jgi:hypothetical protein
VGYSYYTGVPSVGIQFSYWDINGTGIPTSQGVGNVANASGVTGLQTFQLKSGNPTGFDSTVWGSNSSVNNGYPYLLWTQASSSTPTATIFVPSTSPSPTPNPGPSPSGPAGTSQYWNGQLNNFALNFGFDSTVAGSTPPLVSNQTLNATTLSPISGNVISAAQQPTQGNIWQAIAKHFTAGTDDFYASEGWTSASQEIRAIEAVVFATATFDLTHGRLLQLPSDVNNAAIVTDKVFTAKSYVDTILDIYNGKYDAAVLEGGPTIGGALLSGILGRVPGFSGTVVNISASLPFQMTNAVTYELYGFVTGVDLKSSR